MEDEDKIRVIDARQGGAADAILVGAGGTVAESLTRYGGWGSS